MASSRRREAIGQLEKLRLTLTNVAGHYGNVVERLSWNTFVATDDLLDPNSTVTDWLRNGAAVWVQAYRMQVDLYGKICSTIFRPPANSGPRSGIVNGIIHFYIDPDSEASDPVATPVPVAQIDAAAVPPVKGSPLRTSNFELSISSDGNAVLLALVDLQPNTLAGGGPPMTFQLLWPPDGSIAVQVHVLAS